MCVCFGGDERERESEREREREREREKERERERERAKTRGEKSSEQKIMSLTHFCQLLFG